MITPKVPHIFYGGDYNPEQWPEATWLEDARLMQEAGVNLVSLGIFSWALLEPRPSEYDFGWLDRVIDLLYRHGVMVDLATATASPPAWLATLHPESLPVTREGLTLWPGSRQHYCPNSAAYRERAASLVTQIAERYREHPALAMWHVNNEYGPVCCCDASAAAFRVWLERRYGTIEALNEAWSTAFWSQHYENWGEILPPRSAPQQVNPTQQLDYMRFSSDALLECFDMEHSILKKLTPNVPVTTNFMGFYKPLDYWTWADHEDVVSQDSYPDPADPMAPRGAAMTYDLMRSLRHGKPWVLMEQTTSQVNWRAHNVLKRPGQMRLWSFQAVAHGADGVMFFQWRASKGGAEKFHGAMVPHVGTERSRIWREVTGLGAELRRLDPILGSHTVAQVAIVFDWESWWALELDSKPSTDVRLLEQVARYYTPLWERNIAVDFVPPDVNLSAYRLVIIPNLYLLRPGVAKNLQGFVAGGGTLVMSFFSGIVDQQDHILLGGYPASFRDLLGIRVEEFDPYVPGQTNRIALVRLSERGGDETLKLRELLTPREKSFECDLWSDLIDLEGAEAIAVYEEDFYAGRPAITRHTFGSGIAYYLGTRPEESFMAALLEAICRECAVAPLLDVPAGVEVTRRVVGDRSFLFVLNHTPDHVGIEVDRAVRHLLSGEEHEGAVRLGPLGVAVLEEGSSSVPLPHPPSR